MLKIWGLGVKSLFARRLGEEFGIDLLSDMADSDVKSLIVVDDGLSGEVNISGILHKFNQLGLTRLLIITQGEANYLPSFGDENVEVRLVPEQDEENVKKYIEIMKDPELTLGEKTRK